jgi:hypothetical protein
MVKPGTIKLPTNLCPKLKDTYTEEELSHMLILIGLDINKQGLQIFQTTPELTKDNDYITSQEIAFLSFPIVKTAMKDEFIHTKLICLLNNASGQEKEQTDYMVTVVYIADKDNKNLKVADIFFGDPEAGMWATPEQVELFAKSMNVPVYVRG